MSALRGQTVNHGSVTEAYAQNATRITLQIAMERGQCGYATWKEASPPTWALMIGRSAVVHDSGKMGGGGGCIATALAWQRQLFRPPGC